MEMGRRIRKHYHIAGMFNCVVARFCTTGISSIFDGPDSSIPPLVWYDGLIMIMQPRRIEPRAVYELKLKLSIQNRERKKTV